MTTATHPAATAPRSPTTGPTEPPTRATVRTTGLLYVALGVTGMLGFLLVRRLLFAPDDPAATMTNLVEREALARAGIVLELGIVVTQALLALWFQRLFSAVDRFAARAIAALGLVNAVVVLVSAAVLATALEIALQPLLPGAPEAAAQVQLLHLVSEHLWGVGAVFFGLWLLPMGFCVLRAGWLPRALGWVLVAGGVGYVLSALVRHLVPDATVVGELLTAPASVGEFWMIGLLLWHGLRRPVVTPAR